MKNIIVFLLSSIVFTTSCQKAKLDITDLKDHKEYKSSDKDISLNRFSEILSSAIYEDESLRFFIKSHALKQIDNDYNAFYPIIKHLKVSKDKSFRDILVEHSKSEEEISNIEFNLPLLTIYIPELPSGFNAKTWDCTLDIPAVAPRTSKTGYDLYFEGKYLDELPTDVVPGFPLLVVKESQRIRLRSGSQVRKAGESSIQSNLLPPNYEFIYDFDRSTVKSEKGRQLDFRASIGIKTNSSPIKEATDAYFKAGTSGNYWQRDYVYYKILNANDKGRINNRIVEQITSIKLNKNAIDLISEDPNGPILWWSFDQRKKKDHGKTQKDFWSEGQFSMEVKAFIGNISGAGTTITQPFSASPLDLFDIQFEHGRDWRKGKVWPFREIWRTYYVTNVTPKNYPLNMKLINWDLEKNSYTWKFNVIKLNPATTITESFKESIEFAGNFEISSSLGISEVLKIGNKFGASLKRTKQNDFSTSKSYTSVNLGDAILNFHDPVFLSTDGSSYRNYGVKSTCYELIVEPVYAW